MGINKLLTAVLLLTAITAILLAGCASNAPAPAQQQAAAGGDQAVNPAPSGPGAAPAPSGKASDQFTTLLSKRSSLQWKVDYDVKTVSQGQSIDLKMTQYLKGIDHIRTDTTTQGMESRSFFVSGVMTTCSKSSASWTCYKVDTGTKDQVGDLQKDLDQNAAKYTITAEPARTIAGVAASCFKLEGLPENVVAHYCFSTQGVVLYIKMDGAVEGQSFSTEMAATSFTTSVSDSDFTPPAAAQDLGAGAGGSAGAGAGAADPCMGCGYLSGDQKTQCLAACKK